MQKIDKKEYQKRLDKITELFSSMMVHAEEQATYRCPYKNRSNQCTAKFGCRNQRKPPIKGDLLVCGGDDKLDYRSAWETEAVESMHIEDIDNGMGTITHDGKKRSLSTGKTIFDYADELAVQVPTSCFRTGQCHECIVEIRQGMEALVPRNEAESFLRENYRLACQAVVQNADIDIEFSPLGRTPQILTLTQEKAVELDPIVTRRGDLVYYDDEAIDKYRGHLYGLAIDLGTTTVVVDLVDLETGKSVHVSSFENPQRFGGSDVMNRISYDGEFGGELRKAIINALNHEILEMGERLGFVRQEIYEIVVVGNSTMRDIFFRLDVQPIGQKPYKSVIEHAYLAGERKTTSLIEKTRRLGLRANPKAKVYSLPLIASHVGADTTADLVAIDMASQKEVIMLVDVGTNTEVVVGHAGRLVTASCPAGPAFEGGGIKYGMPGYEGAIESIRWRNGHIEYHTIGDVEPQGICGSGLIDLLAELRSHDQMTPKGVFANKKQYELTIVPEYGITCSRQDVSNLAQAKAANYCGQLIVMRHFGIQPADVRVLYLAGGFANYVDVRNAIEIGFLAPVPEDRVVKIGNAAVQGAREVLLSRKKRESVERLVKGIEHVELETTPDFFDVFVEGCQFKPMPMEFAPPATR
ncbi:MAG: ASKHA domain-containing protein [Candidatus Poribacteria bacterium]|nr:ASKHA domain-containing protein [Candidatus Poribacteria bacterium]